MAEKIVQIKSLPGIKRDGTKFEGDQYVDGQWVRFQRGLPRKMGGYRSISKYLREVSRALPEHGFTVVAAKLGYKPKNPVDPANLSPEQLEEVEAFLGAIDNNDDVQNVFVGLAG